MWDNKEIVRIKTEEQKKKVSVGHGSRKIEFVDLLIIISFAPAIFIPVKTNVMFDLLLTVCNILIVIV
jgi:hypothetical protein